MLSSHPGTGNHCDSLNQNNLWQTSLFNHPDLHSVKRNATAVTLRSGQIIIEYTHYSRSIAMIVFHHSKCHVVLTGISTHDAVIWSCQALHGLMCRDSLTTASLLKERHHSVVFKIIRERTLWAHHCRAGMVILFKVAFLVLTCRVSSLHRESLQEEFVK